MITLRILIDAIDLPRFDLIPPWSLNAYAVIVRQILSFCVTAACLILCGKAVIIPAAGSKAIPKDFTPQPPTSQISDIAALHGSTLALHGAIAHRFVRNVSLMTVL